MIDGFDDFSDNDLRSDGFTQQQDPNDSQLLENFQRLGGEGSDERQDAQGGWALDHIQDFPDYDRDSEFAHTDIELDDHQSVAMQAANSSEETAKAARDHMVFNALFNFHGMMRGVLHWMTCGNLPQCRCWDGWKPSWDNSAWDCRSLRPRLQLCLI